ncbi:ABC transporter permease [Actinobacillus succinogenes]|uniref:Cytochrome c assembly protein n=1 Tax=Actinobacillus succinogenes (strain ATCC 55618 / DSM 22257 / CCUG 43843 / 130Z) TaxID=339671 RepID=A6VMC7_ACTSZ|nr:cytochrome c biogenesis protein CcsA [Actinobacillus succinogenes]ABR74124.1 cytochrome c assembly protein [Actinobacillus succinogenes 130Z]PHI39444.1 ABC transporter permease [Actinobacillus succinogenes]
MSYAISSIILYVISILLIAPMLAKAQSSEQAQKSNKIFFILTALLAMISHHLSFKETAVPTSEGTSFSLLAVSSMISLVVSLLVTVPAIFRVKTLSFLLPLVYSFAIINLLLTEFLSAQAVQWHRHVLFHIALSLLTYAVCFIAMLYSMQLLWLDNKLKQKKMMPSPAIPPLMMVERHFFRVMLTGFILLTATLISGSFYLLDAPDSSNLHKALFSFFSWIVFGILLIGHWKYHWRGKRMIIYTISGMILLTIAYFGSRIML